MHHRHHRLFIHSLTFAGLLGCDVPEPAAAPSLREEELLEEVVLTPAPASCFEDIKLVLHHDDKTTDVTSSLAEGLGSLARPNDLVELSFVLAPGCAEEHGSRVTLAAYTSPGITLAVLTPKPPARAFDMHTAPIGPDGGHLWVRLPPCFFAVDLAFGEPLQSYSGPQNPYEAANRLIASGQGGHSSCDAVPRLAVERFEPAEQGWGEAPVSAHFGWKLVAEKDAALTCELDLDGDGQPEQTLAPCQLDTSGTKTAALPVRTFAAVGEHRPAIVVRDGERRIWAATSIFANHLEFKPEVRFPEQMAGFVAAAVEPAQPPELAVVKLQFASADHVPAIAKGEVIVGKGGGSGYMIRAVEVLQKDDGVVVFGEAVGLDDALASGFFGLRDVRVDTAKAGCVTGACLGSVTPVAAPPDGDVGPPENELFAAPKGEEDEDDEEAKFGLKVAGEFAGGAGEIEVFVGFLVERFVIDVGWSGIEKVDIKAGPAAEVAVATLQPFEPEPLELGRYYFGSLPTPVPINVHVAPHLKFEAAFKTILKGSVGAPFEVTKDASGWRTVVDPQLSGDAQGVESEVGLELEGEVKGTVVPEFELSLAFLSGPYIAPTLSLGAKATLDGCAGCLAAFVEGGGEVGWHSDWWAGGELFEPLEVVLYEIELLKKCWELPGACEEPEPEPEPPAGGGSWGDVHLVSHDGLLFDFQAGGEFVLTRATAGGPFEVQTRQEPVGNQLALSYNTALATAVDGHRVGLYTRLPAELHVDGVPTTLAPGHGLALGGGQIERQDAQTYVIDYPTGEQVTVTRVDAQAVEGRHFNIGVRLPGSRAGEVEGLLGDGDGDRSDDLGLGGGVFMPHPVSFAELHASGPGTFAAAWRVDPAASLFDYAVGTDPATFRGAPYSLMPTHEAALLGPHAGLAQELCESCPLILRDTCLLDVSHSGEAGFAESCHSPPTTPAEILPPSDDPVLVWPRNQVFTSCDEQKLVFRAKGAAGADQYPGGDDFEIKIVGREQPPFTGWPASWLNLQTFRTTDAPADGSGWGEQFECEPLGEGSWGECTLWIEPRGPSCSDDLWIQYYMWSVKPLSNPGYTIHDYFYAY